MKKIIAIVLLIAALPAFGQVHVRGYTKKDGTYVAPHMRSSPNNTTLDNYSTKGNVNPYTGQAGTKDPEPYGYQNPRPTQRVQQTRPNAWDDEPSTLQPAPQRQQNDPYQPLKY